MDHQEQFALELYGSNASESDLFEGLGENSGDALAFEDASPEQKRLAGINWWTAHAADIKTVVCKIASDKDASNAVIKDVLQIAFAALGAQFGMAVAAYATAIAVRKVTEGWCGQRDGI